MNSTPFDTFRVRFPDARAPVAVDTAAGAVDVLSRHRLFVPTHSTVQRRTHWVVLAAGILALLPSTAKSAATFQSVTLDSSYIAYQRAVGDVDSDGDNDIVAVQEGDTTLQVFRAPSWPRTTLISFSGTNRYPRADDIKLADLDNDGDLDVVTRLGPGPTSDAAGIAIWCENLGNGTFTQRLIGTSLEYTKDFAVADFDRDGRKDVAMRMDARTQIWLQTGTGTWTEVLLNHAPHEGMDAGDLDMDGDPDLIMNGFWFATPNTPAAARVASNWVNRTIDAAWFNQGGDWTADSCKVAVSDYDGDGVNDVAFSHSERPGYSVAWYRSSGANGIGPWIKQSIAVIDYCHTLQSADWDLDGDTDLLAGGMIQSQHRGLRLLLNSGNGSSWTQQVIQSDGSYSARRGDVDNDGDPDIVGIRNWDSAPTYIFRNTSTPTADSTRPTVTSVSAISATSVQLVFSEPVTVASAQAAANYTLNNGASVSAAVLGGDGRTATLTTSIMTSGGSSGLDSWLYKQVSGSHVRTFSLGFKDIDGDGDLDIASGPFVYLNPGPPLTGTWTKIALPSSVHAFAGVDVDGDTLADLIAQKDNPAGGRVDIYWVEAANANGLTWATPVLIGNVPRGSEPEGIQGYAVSQLVAGGRPEVIVNSPQGVYYFSIPVSNPGAGNWPRVFVATNDSEEGIGVADIDADGDLDVSFTTGSSKQVKWARNPGNGAGDWNVFVVGTFAEADWPDRCIAADLNGDGRVDIAVTEENAGGAADALACWWEQPAAGPTTVNWARRTITTQYTMNSLDVGDVDRDGDMDLVLAEHRGTKRIAVWANNGQGLFSERRVGEGRESHLGGRLADLDNDGDLDLVSIAYDTFSEIHLWRNDNAATSGTYVLTVNNVADRANPPNTILANSQTSFSYTPAGDTTRPTITSAAATSATSVQVVFSEPVTSASAQSTANYALNNSVTISAAALGADTRTVTLTTSVLPAGSSTLTVNNVADRATPANSILANSQISFTYSSGATSLSFISAASAVDFDGNSNASLTFSQPAVAQGYVVVGISMYCPVSSAGVTAASYDGMPMALLGTAESSNGYTEVFLYGLAVGSKAAGSYLISLTASGGIDQIVFGVAAFSGVQQTASTGGFAFATGWSTAPSVNVGSGVGDQVVDILSHDSGSTSLGGDQFLVWKQEDQTDRTDGVSSYKFATNATTTVTYSMSVSAPWSIGAIALKGGAAPVDTTRPTITSAASTSATSVQVVFSEPVTSASAQSTTNYAMNNSVAVSAAALGPDTRTVTLTTSVLPAGSSTLTVNNVADRATPANSILANSQATFSFSPPADTTAPTSPLNLTGTAINTETVLLAWVAATDNVGVTVYLIFRDGTLAGTTSSMQTSFQDTGRTAATAYIYDVIAEDAAGNTSAPATVSVTTPAGTPAAAVLRVNAGGGGFVDAAGQAWAADTGFNTGETYTVTTPIEGTNNDPLFQSERYDPGTSPELIYSFNVVNGTYTVNLHFAEIFWTSNAVGRRVFDVFVEGQLRIDDLDIFARSGANTALLVSLPVTVGDGQLNLSFGHVADNPKISAIEILSGQPTDPPSTDIVAPTITSVTALNTNSVQAVFSEPVTSATAQSTINYAINNGVSIAAATLGADTRTVTLTTSVLPAGNSTLTVNNIADRATPANNIVANSQTSFSVTPPADTTPPTPPLNLVGTAPNATTVQLTWQPATDNVGVNQYLVFRGGTMVGTVSTTPTSFQDTGRSPATTYVYDVIAEDAAGNDSAPAVVSVTTPTGGAIRVTAGMMALYRFAEGAGSIVHDTGGAGTPLDLTILDQSKVQWVGGNARGARISGIGTAIRSPGAASKIHAAVMASNRISMEVWITPANLTQEGPTRIVSLSGGTTVSDVDAHIGQDFQSGSFRLRTTANAFSWLQASSTFSGTTQPRHIIVTYDGATQRIFVNGILHGTTAALSGNFSTWNTGYPLILGNETTLDRSWLGTIHLVAIYNRALSGSEILQNFSAGPVN